MGTREKVEQIRKAIDGALGDFELLVGNAKLKAWNEAIEACAQAILSDPYFDDFEGFDENHIADRLRRMKTGLSLKRKGQEEQEKER